MKRPLLPALAAMLAVACTTGSGSPPGRMIGVHDQVTVDDLPTNGAVASLPGADDAGVALAADPATTGVPNRYVFITSSDNNELKVLSLFVPGYVTRAFVPAPDPLGSLSIPVLDRPSMLAVDEGLDTQGRRVTGPFVYAARAGGAQLSVVDATPQGFAQVTRAPLATPAPVTAMAAWMGAGLTVVPDTTTLYYATWDGSRGQVYALALPTARARRGEVKSARAALKFDVGGEAVVAMQLVPPLAGRTLDGQPFCAGPSACLAIATRSRQGATGRTLLVQLDTLRAAPLAYPATVREFATAGQGERLYALLDEEACVSGCSGAIAVDTRTGTSPAGFPVLLDFSGRPMLPVDVGGVLPRGLTLARSNAQASLFLQRGITTDGGFVTIPSQYAELGIVSNSLGRVYAFDGPTGINIDFIADRSVLAGAYLEVPLAGEDGGVLAPDAGGGVVDTVAALADVTPYVGSDGKAADPIYRSYLLVPDGGTYGGDPATALTVADGYLVTQTVTVQRQGVIAPMNLLPTTSADGALVRFPAGSEARLELGDLVNLGSFQLQPDGTTIPVSCGEAPITGLGSGFATFAAVPTGCDGRTVYSIFAGPTGTVAHPLVVTASVDGYLGRVSDGETFTYTRRFAVRPDGWDSSDRVVRPALSLTLGSLPQPRGSRWVFTVRGNIERFHAAFDPGNVGCTPYLAGKVRLATVPTYITQTSTNFSWALLTLFPAGNGVIFAPVGSGAIGYLSELSLGAMTGQQGAACFR